MYDEGVCVPQNRSGAAKLYWSAAEQDVPFAQARLAFLYLTGDGVGQSDEQAFQWYSKAANSGDPASQFMTGQLYRDGRGTTKDDIAALMWFNLALASGSKIDGTAPLKARMSADDIAVAEVRAQYWLRNHPRQR
jgi:TPR repeat protein